ncbi:MATE family efflux transporter [Treponema phagedenis]|uniref:Multidrug export protein MepA n=1 Tax=Treponema phagedenis TaxID=162 RepID=A0A0B7GY27_TREPH|nr:MATE family efflux transporter [Treponema phagedenis]EFW36492.1 MATE efflux family protein [Treponema phagedenis F0421]NVP23944.1 MATE family efflux transporter [Treponema phagedenis]QEJ93855.1 MATE family efflux transporter [Treponema phagedenis]QEJ96613.1 MATE family efflux transporter [Treponema phagedenis]QEJ99780.1 MATE family efflux transporter [Treponema phagedenis]
MNNQTKVREQELILHGNVWGMMWSLSWPAIVAMVLFGMNVVVDGIFVGQYCGETALAGVTLVYPITQILQGFGSLIGVGAGSYLSILIGKKALKEQGTLIGNVNFLIIVFSIIITGLGLLSLNPLMKLLGASAEESVFALAYIRPLLYGSIFWIAGLAYNMIVRAEGKMATAAWMMGVGLLCNIICNYIFMAIFNLGVFGAALGTNIGMLLYTLAFLIYAARGKASFPTNAAKFYRESGAQKEILSLGFPSLLMTIMYVIQSLIIMKALNSYGTQGDVAFYGNVFRLFNLFLTPIYGLMRALQPAIGINYGAKNYDRVIKSYRVFSVAATLLMLPLWLVSFFFPEMMLGLMLPNKIFTPDEILSFRIFISVAPFLPIIFMAMTFWPAIEKPKPAGIFGIARQVLLYIPAMIILPKYFGISWIYKGSFLIDIFLCAVVALMINKEFKRLKSMKVQG